MGMPEKKGKDEVVLEITNVRPSTSNASPPPPPPPSPPPLPPPPTSNNWNPNSKSGAGKDKGDSATTKIMSKMWDMLLEITLRFVFGLIFLIYGIFSPNKWAIWVIFEWLALFCFTGILVTIFKVDTLQNHLIWEFELWKWCALIMVIVCGRLICEWLVNAVFVLTYCFFANKIKVYYLAYGLKKKNGGFCLWWGLILVVWVLLVEYGGDKRRRSKETQLIVDYITRALASLFIGAGIWLAKGLSLWSIALSFQSKIFFHRIVKAVFCRNVIKRLSSSQWYSFQYGPRLMRIMRTYGIVFNWAEEMKKGIASAVSIVLFIDVISSDDYSMLRFEDNNGKEFTDEEVFAKQFRKEIIENVLESRKKKEKAAKTHDQSSLDSSKTKDERKKEKAPTATDQISSDSSKTKDESLVVDDSTTIQRVDIERLMLEKNFSLEEVNLLFKINRKALFGKKKQVDQSKKEKEQLDSISGEDLKRWLIMVFQECNSLESSLKNTRKAIQEMDKIFSALLLVAIILVWLVLMKVLTTQIVALILTQLLALVFVFGDTCKRIFEGIIFLFATRPYDVGDLCVIDGQKIFVKEVNIQKTVFSRDPVGDIKDDDDDDDDEDDNDDKDHTEQIVYPNSVLATQYIRNFQAPPKLDMTESVEFVLNTSNASVEEIKKLKTEIETEMTNLYYGSKKIIKNTSVLADGFQNGDKIKMTVYVTYKNIGTNSERGKWKSELVLGLRQILQNWSKEHNVEVEPEAAPGTR